MHRQTHGLYRIENHMTETNDRFSDFERRRTLWVHLNRATVIDILSRHAVHDLRNALQAVDMAAESLVGSLGDDDAPELLDLVVRAARRAQDRLDQIGSVPFRAPADVGSASVAECAEWIGHALGMDQKGGVLRLHTDLRMVPPVQADRTGLTHLLLNLVLNAREALGSGGAGSVHIRGRTTGETLQLDVVDDGPGVPDGTRERIFEPFFTTKTERHFGLGLPVAVALARAWGGDLALAPPDGRGACFQVRLPVAPAPR